MSDLKTAEGGRFSFFIKQVGVLKLITDILLSLLSIVNKTVENESKEK